MARKKFSESMVIATLTYCGVNVLCYRCKQKLELGQKIEREHVTEIALGGADDPSNCAYSHKACHAIQTNGTKATTAGSSKQRIAKVRRLRGETCKGPTKKIQSRGFDKTKTRRFDGKVIAR